MRHKSPIAGFDVACMLSCGVCGSRMSRLSFLQVGGMSGGWAVIPADQHLLFDRLLQDFFHLGGALLRQTRTLRCTGRRCVGSIRMTPGLDVGHKDVVLHLTPRFACVCGRSETQESVLFPSRDEAGGTRYKPSRLVFVGAEYAWNGEIFPLCFSFADMGGANAFLLVARQVCFPCCCVFPSCNKLRFSSPSS